jgi:lipopolysaccharide export system permease protein
MAIAVVGQAQSTRQNRNMRMGLCFLAGVGIRLTGLAVNNVVTLHASAVPLLYLIPLSAIGISMFLIVRGARARKPNPRIERLMDAAGALAAGLKQRFSRAAPAAAGRAGG